MPNSSHTRLQLTPIGARAGLTGCRGSAGLGQQTNLLNGGTRRRRQAFCRHDAASEEPLFSCSILQIKNSQASSFLSAEVVGCTSVDKPWIAWPNGCGACASADKPWKARQNEAECSETRCRDRKRVMARSRGPVPVRGPSITIARRPCHRQCSQRRVAATVRGKRSRPASWLSKTSTM